MPPEFYKSLQFSAVVADGSAKICQGLSIILEGEAATDINVKLEKFYNGLDSLARVIEEYIRILPAENYEFFKRLANELLEIECGINFEQGMGDEQLVAKYKRMLRRSANSILLELSKDKYKPQPVHPLRGRTKAEQLEKNQGAMAWLKSRREEKLSEEELRQAREDFEMLEQIVDDGREEDRKIFS